MKIHTTLSSLFAAMLMLSCSVSTDVEPYNGALMQIPFNKVTLQDDFWLPRLNTQKQTLVPFSLEKTEYAARLKATGIILSYICPLMYMNNPLCKSMPVITCSNKLRTYTTSRFYTEEEILGKIIGGK